MDYAQQTITTAPTVAPYPGMRWIYHRLQTTREYMFDFKTHTFGPGEYKQMPEMEAIWMYEHHRAQEFPAREEDPDPAVRAEAIQYAFALDDDPKYGVPLVLESEDRREYLSRDGMPMYAQRGTDAKTTPRLIRVGQMPGALEEAPAPPANGTTPSPDVLELAKTMAQQMARQMMDEFLKSQPRRVSGRSPRRRSRPPAPTPEAPVE